MAKIQPKAAAGAASEVVNVVIFCADSPLIYSFLVEKWTM
jgi:hypothetical protein